MNDPMQNVTNTKTLDINFNPPVSYNLNLIPTGDILFRSRDLPDNFFTLIPIDLVAPNSVTPYHLDAVGKPLISGYMIVISLCL